MQYSSNLLPLSLEYKTLPKDFPAICQPYVQEYQPNNELHYHNCLEIGFCVEGNGTEMRGNQIYSFKNNNISVIQSNCIHENSSECPNYHQRDRPAPNGVRLELIC